MEYTSSITLRHTLATLAYRLARAIRNAPPEFADFKAGNGTRTPVVILAHIGDLMDWSLTGVNGAMEWRTAKPLPWDQEVIRVFAAIERLDQRLSSDSPIQCPGERLFQGPLADALTHVGQISTLRRVAGSATGGENYYVAEIVEGRVGLDQAKPKKEFA